MKIALFNLEPKYKNLALEKLRLYHQNQDDDVEDYFALKSYDKIYASSIFSFTDKSTVPQGAICGGTGFDLTAHLPPEVEAVKPRLNFGFITRGCIRNCSFCVVPRKEGSMSVEGTLLDLWDGCAKEVKVLDNNILAVPDSFNQMCEMAAANHITVDINQGLDHRLLTPEICQKLKAIPHVEYHFAFDHPQSYKGVAKAIRILADVGIKRSTWYVLVGYDTTHREDLFRLQFLKWHGQNAFVQRYHRDNRVHLMLARWANQHHIFQGMTWDEFLKQEYPADRERYI